jgi:chromosome transmission fidelity protein 8
MDSTVKLYPPDPSRSSESQNPLPPLIKTPSGLALLELQGSINFTGAQVDAQGKSDALPVGKIVFPDYKPDLQEEGSTAWMKKVYLYVGQHQRLTGEVKKLPKALAVVRKRQNEVQRGSGGEIPETGEQLEVVEIVHYKVMFSNRPEPVGTT